MTRWSSIEAARLVESQRRKLGEVYPKQTQERLESEGDPE
jgi:hypothetical protein